MQLIEELERLLCVFVGLDLSRFETLEESMEHHDSEVLAICFRQGVKIENL